MTRLEQTLSIEASRLVDHQLCKVELTNHEADWATNPIMKIILPDGTGVDVAIMGDHHLTLSHDEFTRRYIKPACAELRRRQRPEPKPDLADALITTTGAMVAGLGALAELMKHAIAETDRRLTALERRLPPQNWDAI